MKGGLSMDYYLRDVFNQLGKTYTSLIIAPTFSLVDLSFIRPGGVVYRSWPTQHLWRPIASLPTFPGRYVQFRYPNGERYRGLHVRPIHSHQSDFPFFISFFMLFKRGFKRGVIPHRAS
ncbi:hypothetical protein HanRHA438_Chr08g0358181 [Helianthus annuus]|nr:hypothetical protein HanIR_Chr08g0373401 [Helianthus annuus]KAJ0898557.1 hypothetical protein HanRHA438_Chr08g0358181 [Helianthus annuus]